MQIEVLFQKDGKDTLEENIKLAFRNKPKKAYFFCGNLRDTGFKILEDEIIDSDVKLYFAIGIDKKNTTRNMLEELLKYTENVYYYSNNGLSEFSNNISIFEYSKYAVMYIASTKMSESGLKDDISIFFKVTYSLEDDIQNKEYKSNLKSIINVIEKEKFIKLDKEKIEELVEQKEIFTTRQYVHNILSISELLEKDNEKGKENKNVQKEEVAEDVFKSNIEIPKVDLSDSDIDIGDIDISEVEEKEEKTDAYDISKDKKDNENDIEVDFQNEKEFVPEKLIDESTVAKQNESKYDDDISTEDEHYDETLDDFEYDENDALDINNMLFSKSDLKLDMDSIEEEEKNKENLQNKEETLQVKKVNLSNISNFIYEMPSKGTKVKDANFLKIPNYIQTTIPEFFELSTKGKNIEIDGNMYKVRVIKLEVVDVKNNKKYIDREAKLMHKVGQSYFTINTDVLKNINYEENDIARIIKLSTDIYHIEIISKDMQEYKLWSKVCTQKFKSTTRKYGMM